MNKQHLFFFLFQLTSANEVLEKIQNQEYNYELLLFALVLILIYVFINGQNSNLKIVSKFFEENLEILKENFYHVGLRLQEFETVDQQTLMNNPDILEKDSPNFFRVFLLGRFNVKYSILSLYTKRRQDLLVSLIYSIFYPEKDRIFLESSLPEDQQEKGLLYVANKSKIKNMISDYEDLRTLCKSYNIQNMNLKKIKIFAESHETLECVLTREIKQTMEELQDYIESIELSDCYNNELSKGNTFKMVITMGKGKQQDLENVGRLIEMYYQIVDSLQAYKPSSKQMEKFKKNRMNFNSKKKQAQLDEIQQTKRDEKIKNMTQAEKEKYKEKKMKRMQNKMARKVKAISKAQLILLKYSKWLFFYVFSNIIFILLFNSSKLILLINFNSFIKSFIDFSS